MQTELMSDNLNLFVYGTLKPDEAGYRRYCEPYVATVRLACAKGELFHLPQGYPAMTIGDRWVKGALITLQDAAAITHIDDFEDYDPMLPDVKNLYIRQQYPVFSQQHEALGQAWVYLMSPQRVRQLNGILVAEGEWSRQQWPSIGAIDPTFSDRS